MTITVSEATKAKILVSDILNDHPEPPAPSLYFDSVMVRKNLDTGLMEFVMQRDGQDVFFMAAHNPANLDAGETVTFGRFAGYMLVSISA